MKYLRSLQDSLLGFSLKLGPATHKTSVYAPSLMALGLALLPHAVQAESALPYQPALGHYQRFEQGSAAITAQPIPAQDHAAHETHAPVRHDHQPHHEMSTHEQSYDHSPDRSHDHGHVHAQE